MLTLNTPDSAAYFTAGSQVLLSGHVQSPDAPLSSVQVNGTQASVIDAAGNVETARVIDPVHPRYDSLLTNAAKKWQYQPAKVDGTPVRFLKRIQVSLDPGSGGR